ncbi:putative F420-dependent oxidoreductase [Thermosporothrix hazakensis]|jgi:probable F420-dependent oxidoreductase|uniref:Putative F420-dependent oxidoreductase n=1 Tax=Thermosporothrix hazakensis TaxID=644383 RepID=A0A326U3N9_THEHA|nr:LLM class F420-dependent oxidoreductase [Thermosporothrix hazakensis]PZW26134.1 putative F420-dependent oxidoreductase [Thermosporothrix hazakensis]GCE51394.1 LLM class F420-dependent oxidoreductase [Thermosporothrix hazakensis]
MTTRSFRFGVMIHQAQSKEELQEKAKRAEQLGYSTLLLPDHIGIPLAPVPALLAAVEATSTLRVGSYVFNNDFRHPVMLAKEAATLDILSGGRFEFGIGAGWLKSEYEQIGLSFDAGATRVERLEEAVQIMKALFTGEPVTFSGNHYTIKDLRAPLKPLQEPQLPLLIGGSGKRILSLAGREASIAAITARVVPDTIKPIVSTTTPEATQRKIKWIRQAAGERFSQIELHLTVLLTLITDDRAGTAQQFAPLAGMTAEQILESPHCLMGTVEQISEEVYRLREQYGFSYLGIYEESMEAFAPVIARLSNK